MQSVTERLLGWYKLAPRQLPWKASRDPYKIWLSEIILQQTRVQQGTPYYLKFTEKYPTVRKLAKAPLDDVLKLWEGLGYYSRARNLHFAANQVINDFDGVFPTDYKSLLKLKGVGEYTAAAIASFAYDEPVAVVDGNVFRFISRLYGIATPIDSTTGKKQFKQKAQQILDINDPATHNQAIMDFGALICSPRKPQCAICPFSLDCVAFQEDRIGILPVKSKAIVKRHRFFTYYILHDENRVIIQKREGKDIWNGLYQFPMVEQQDLMVETSENGPETSEFASLKKKALSNELFKGCKQDLSHQRIHANFVVLQLEDLHQIDMLPGWIGVSLSELFSYAYPKLIHSFLAENSDWYTKDNRL